MIRAAKGDSNPFAGALQAYAIHNSESVKRIVQSKPHNPHSANHCGFGFAQAWLAIGQLEPTPPPTHPHPQKKTHTHHFLEFLTNPLPSPARRRRGRRPAPLGTPRGLRRALGTRARWARWSTGPGQLRWKRAELIPWPENRGNHSCLHASSPQL